AGLRAQAQHYASRHQTGEHDADAAGRGEADGLRNRALGHGWVAYFDRDNSGLTDLYAAGAGARRVRGRALGHLFVWRFTLRTAHGEASFPRRFAVFANDRASESATALAHQSASRPAAGVEPDHPDGHGQGAWGSLSNRGCFSERAENCAGVPTADLGDDLCSGSQTTFAG